MSRITAGLIVLALLGGVAAPIAALAEAHHSNRSKSKCCEMMGGHCNDATSMDCCGENPLSPSTPPPPQQSSPSPSPSKKWGAPIALLPEPPAPELARVASIPFLERQRLLQHARSHLRLHVFLI